MVETTKRCWWEMRARLTMGEKISHIVGARAVRGGSPKADTPLTQCRLSSMWPKSKGQIDFDKKRHTKLNLYCEISFFRSTSSAQNNGVLFCDVSEWVLFEWLMPIAAACACIAISMGIDCWLSMYFVDDEENVGALQREFPSRCYYKWYSWIVLIYIKMRI